MAELITIGALSARSGVPATTLRYYDQLGLVRPAARCGGQRRYDEDGLRRLRLVGLCREAGFTLAETGALLDGGAAVGTLARRKVAELDERLARLTTARAMVAAVLACGCGELATCDRPAAVDPALHEGGD